MDAILECVFQKRKELHCSEENYPNLRKICAKFFPEGIFFILYYQNTRTRICRFHFSVYQSYTLFSGTKRCACFTNENVCISLATILPTNIYVQLN